MSDGERLDYVPNGVGILTPAEVARFDSGAEPYDPGPTRCPYCGHVCAPENVGTPGETRRLGRWEHPGLTAAGIGREAWQCPVCSLAWPVEVYNTGWKSEAMRQAEADARRDNVAGRAVPYSTRASRRGRSIFRL